MKQIKEVGIKFDLVANVKDKNIKDLEKRAEKLARYYESVIKKTSKIKEAIDRSRTAQRSLNTVSIQYGNILSKNLDTIQKISKSTKNMKPIEVKAVSINPKSVRASMNSGYTTSMSPGNTMKNRVGDEKIYANAITENKKYDTKKIDDYTKLFDQAIKAENDAFVKRTNHYNKLFDEADKREENLISKRTKEKAIALEMNKRYDQQRMDEHGKALELNKKYDEKRIKEEDRVTEDRAKMYATAFEMNKKYDLNRDNEHGKAIELNKKYDQKRIDEHGKALEIDKQYDEKKKKEHGQALEMNKKYDQQKFKEESKITEDRAKMYANAFEMNKKYDAKKMEDYSKLFDQAIKNQDQMYANAFEMDRKFNQKRAEEHGRAIELNKKYDQHKMDEHGKALEMNRKYDEQTLTLWIKARERFMKEEESLLEKKNKQFANAMEMNRRYDEKKISDYTRLFDQAIKAQDDMYATAMEMNRRYDAKKIADYTELFDKAIKAEDKRKEKAMKDSTREVVTTSERVAKRFSELDHAANLLERTFNSLKNAGTQLALSEKGRMQGQALRAKYGDVFKQEEAMLAQREGLTQNQASGQFAILAGRAEAMGMTQQQTVELIKGAVKGAQMAVGTGVAGSITEGIDKFVNVIDKNALSMENLGIGMSSTEAEKGATEQRQKTMNRVATALEVLSKNPAALIGLKEGMLSQEINKLNNVYANFASSIESKLNPQLTKMYKNLNDFIFKFVQDERVLNLIGKFVTLIGNIFEVLNKNYEKIMFFFNIFSKVFYISALFKGAEMAGKALKGFAGYLLSFGGLLNNDFMRGMISKLPFGDKIADALFKQKMGIPVRVVNANEISGSGSGGKGGLFSLGSKAGGYVMKKMLPFLTRIGPIIMGALTTILPFIPAILAVVGAGYLFWKAYKNSKKEDEVKEEEKKSEEIAKKITSFKFVETDLKARSLERYKQGVNARFDQDLGIVGRKTKDSMSGRNNTAVTIENNINVSGSDDTNKDLATIIEKTNNKNAMQLNDSMAMGGV